MSDLSIYELQDCVWDEFGESDDHIVPHPADKTGVQCTVQSDSHKKLRLEESSISSNANHSTNFVVLGKREEDPLTLTKRDKMLEKGSWSCAANGGFPSSYDGDSVKEIASMASDDSRMSDRCFKSGTSGELCATDSFLSERSAVDNNLYQYSLSQSQTESNLTFFNNGDKEGNDLYYEWPDIGFGDVDKMFRNCESTYELGNLSNDDGLGWFSCPEPTELRSVLQNAKDSGPDGDLSFQDSRSRNETVSDNLSSQISYAGEDVSFDHLQFVNGLDRKSGNKEESIPQEEMNLHLKQSKLQQHQSEGKGTSTYLDNGDAFQHDSLLEQTMEAKVPLSEQAHQVISFPNAPRHKHNGISNSWTNMQMHSYMTADYPQLVGQISECPTFSSIKCENNSQPSPSTKESSYASNQVQFSHGSFEGPTAINDGKGSLQKNQKLRGNNLNHLHGSSPTAISDPVAVLKRVRRTDNDFDGNSEIDGISKGVTKEVDPSLVQDSSCMSSMLEEISLEATSFRQLQQITEQLDISTKLCIRDSLYRLARSAEQRHNCANPIGGNRSNGASIVEESNKCNGFMDVETDTNPIDRSVAHLLYHRPSDPSLAPGSNDVLSPNAMILRSVTSTPITVVEKDNHVEETSAKPEKLTS